MAALAGVFLWQFFSHPSKKINPVIDRSARIEGAPSEYPYLTSDYLNARYSDYYENPEASDSLYLCALKDIIAENERQNPFDNLEENQKYNFQNIQEPKKNYKKCVQTTHRFLQ